MAKSFLEIMEQREEITKGEWTLYYPIGPRIAWLRGIGMRCKCNTPNSTGIICAFPVAKTLGEPTFPIPPYLRTHSTHIIPNRLSSIKSHITLCPNVITAWTKFPSRFFARSVLQSGVKTKSYTAFSLNLKSDCSNVIYMIKKRLYCSRLCSSKCSLLELLYTSVHL